MSSKISIETDIGSKLSLKNFDTMHEKIELSAQRVYEYAGLILKKRKETVFSEPLPPPNLQQGRATEMLYQARLNEYVKTLSQYQLQKASIAVEIQRILEEELKRLMDLDPNYCKARDAEPSDPIGMWKAIHEKVASGVHFTRSNFITQVKKIMTSKMSDKESLASYRYRYAEDLTKADVMAKKVGIREADFKANATFSMLFAGNFLEGLAPRFDQLRKDLRAETMTNVKFPDNMGEAIALAEKYDGLKGEILTIKDLQNDLVGSVKEASQSTSKKDANEGIVAPIKHGNGKGKGKEKSKDKQEEKSQVKGNSNKTESGKKDDNGRYTDPNKPPPKPWPGMKYCARHKYWCKHSTSDCTLAAEKVNVCFECEDGLASWPGWDQL